MEPKRTWEMTMILSELTAEQVDELLDAMIAKIEQLGGYMGGGISPVKDGPEVQDGEIEKAKGM